MTKQKSPHTQTQANVKPEQTDFEYAAETPSELVAESDVYKNAAGAETGTQRSPRKVQRRPERRKTEPEPEASEGSVHTRTPKRPVQGITSHSATEESERQSKVVKNRPDAKAGLNRSRDRRRA
jgi:hypothetical protein